MASHHVLTQAECEDLINELQQNGSGCAMTDFSQMIGKKIPVTCLQGVLTLLRINGSDRLADQLEATFKAAKGGAM